MIFSVYYLLTSYSKKKNYLNIAFPISFSALLFTYTRSALLGFIFVSFLHLVLGSKGNKNQFGLLCALIIVFHYVTKYELHLNLLEYIGLINKNIVSDERVSLVRFTSSAGSRLYFYIAGLEAFFLNFIFSHGSEFPDYNNFLLRKGISVKPIFGIPGANLIYKDLSHN